MENLGESVKQLREEMNAWGGPEEQEILNDLVKEIPFASEQLQVSNQSPAVSVDVPPVSTPVFTISMPFSTNDDELSELQARLTAVRTSGPTMNVSQGMTQGILQTGTAEEQKNEEKWYTPASATLPYPGLDGHPTRRIIPTPISLAMSEPATTFQKSPDQLKQETDDLIQRLCKEKE